MKWFYVYVDGELAHIKEQRGGFMVHSDSIGIGLTHDEALDLVSKYEAAIKHSIAATIDSVSTEFKANRLNGGVK
jgi:hypothetical protein